VVARQVQPPLYSNCGVYGSDYGCDVEGYLFPMVPNFRCTEPKCISTVCIMSKEDEA